MEHIKNLLGLDAYSALLNENIKTINKFIMANPKSLQQITGASAETVKEMFSIVSEEIIKGKFSSAYDIEPKVRISTGCEKLDKMLLGGIPTTGISELYGCSGVGKTQFCLQLSLQHQLLNISRTEVVYICSEDIFPSKRMKQLTNELGKKFKVDPNFEDHIFIKHIADFQELQKCLSVDLPKLLSITNVGLIIIDSIAGIFRSSNDNPDYVARSNDLMEICTALTELQDQYNCAIFMVNQVTDNVVLETHEPCLGLSWANNITHRFCLSRISNNLERKFTVIFSPELSPISSKILLTVKGLTDAQ
ncbi:DNA repair protein XRCC3 [Euwallacea similis]|uniref:DNA repair protein XRCC3 n=1 Tax=Euwallacea similis TaxID=1736056 RepID=UPI00344D21C4